MDSQHPDSPGHDDYDDLDLQATRRELDGARRRIAELTEELEATNRGIIALHTELDSAREAEARARAEHEVLADRERIAEQLHQQVIRRLMGASLDLTGTIHLITRPGTADRVQRAVDDIDDAVRQLRGTIFDLNPPERSTGLQNRLVDLVSRASTVLGFIPSMSFQGSAMVEAVPADIAAGVLAAAEDALAVIGCREGATTAEFTLSVADDVVLTATDDGTLSGLGDEAQSRRLLGQLDQRARALGGGCHPVHTPGTGNRLEWRVPLSRDGAAPESPVGTAE